MLCIFFHCNFSDRNSLYSSITIQYQSMGVGSLSFLGEIELAKTKYTRFLSKHLLWHFLMVVLILCMFLEILRKFTECLYRLNVSICA